MLEITVDSGLPFCHSGDDDAATTVGGCKWTVSLPQRGGGCADSITLVKESGCSQDWVPGTQYEFELTDPMLTFITPSQANLQFTSVAVTQGSVSWRSGSGIPATLPITALTGVDMLACQ